MVEMERIEISINLIKNVDLDDENEDNEQTREKKHIWFSLLSLLPWFITIKLIMIITVECK